MDVVFNVDVHLIAVGPKYENWWLDIGQNRLLLSSLPFLSTMVSILYSGAFYEFYMTVVPS
jgi:hypothetical protein